MNEDIEQLLGFGLEMKRLGFIPRCALVCISHNGLLLERNRSGYPEA
jgi:hypothetical protein